MRSDEELALAYFRKGDPKAYEEIVDRHGTFVFNIAWGILRDRGLAEEVAVTGQNAQKTKEGRLWIRAKILNQTSDQMWVQVQTEFKDGAGFSYGDVTPWKFVRLEKNSTS